MPLHNLLDSSLLQKGAKDNLAEIEQLLTSLTLGLTFQSLMMERWKLNIYCRKEGNEIPAVGVAEMTLFKDNVKKIKGPLADFLKSHVKAAPHRTF